MANLIDPEVLASLRELQSIENPTFIKEYFVLYLDSIPNLLQQIQMAIDNNNSKALAMATHALKSSSANSGVSSVRSICNELEELANSGTTSGAFKGFKELETKVAELRNEIFSLPEFEI